MTSREGYTRQDYLNGEITHDQYYLELAQEHHIVLTDSDLALFGIGSLKQLRELLSRDEHLNNIPLRRFDSLTCSYNAYNPTHHLTLAEGCCIYKTLLKQLANLT